ncbi:hypothetical protein Tdes44962_MAKER07106 [Teratosphaeria destructans]|uniref:Secreted protein n=1 Tax=Teratosphaeria destructans TaxID=418781 RepID=A0A9W7W6L6_9PEZI|nr:hypothetical protein Tdes44962_MAKER07106 [Teratosphaeria destructans]
MKVAILLYIIPAVLAWTCQPSPNGQDAGYCNPNAQEEGAYGSAQMCDPQYPCKKKDNKCDANLKTIWVKERQRYENRAKCY